MANTIIFQVHPTPMKPGDDVQTYHPRQCKKNTVRTEELADHIAKHGLISKGLFLMVMERLKRELVEQLLGGHDLHIDGIGRFSLQLGTKKVKGEDGKLVKKVYRRPEELTAHELVIEGLTFVPDKEMLDSIRENDVSFSCDRSGYNQNVSRSDMLAVLDDYCEKHGGFSRTIFQSLFGVSRYRAQQMLEELVSESEPLFFREKFGASYVYRKTKAK
jgi:predicted histone-like DNA-binding protein